MYDASKGHSISGSDSNLVFGLIFVAVIIAAFCIAFFVPVGSKDSKGLADMKLTSTNNALLAELNDPYTEAFFVTLAEVDPDAALDLEIDAEIAIEDGADKNELVALLFATTDPSDLRALSKANVKHFDAILRHTKSGLDEMSRGRSKWCKGHTYERFADMSQYAIMKEAENTFGYGSDAYQWGIQLNTLVLRARLDGERNPVNNGKLTPQDETVMQNAMMKLITNPQVMQIMMASSQSKQQQKAAIRNVDFCNLGGSALGIVMSLPTGTRQRLWGEMGNSLNGSGLEQALSQMGGF